MNSKRNLIAATTLAAMMQPLLAIGQTPAKHVPAKATPPASHTLTATSVVHNNQLKAAPTKPTVVTAVAPKPLVGPTQKGIIFVGGKPSPGSKSALNPQPIPPGRGGPGDPVH